MLYNQTSAAQFAGVNEKQAIPRGEIQVCTGIWIIWYAAKDHYSRTGPNFPDSVGIHGLEALHQGPNMHVGLGAQTANSWCGIFAFLLLCQSTSP